MASVDSPRIEDNLSKVHSNAEILVGVYGGAVVLLVFFFAFEDAPWHYSRRVETIYLSFVLVLIYAISFLFGYPYSDLLRTWDDPFGACSVFFGYPCSFDPYDSSGGTSVSRLSVLYVQHLLMLVTILFFIGKHVVPSTKTARYEEHHHACNEPHRLQKFVANQPLVIRWARELNESIRELEDLIEDSWLLPSTTITISLTNLSLLMLCDVVTAVPPLGNTVYNFARILNSLMLAYIIWSVVHGWRAYGKFAGRGTKLLKQIVKEENGTALKYLLATVSLRALLEMSKDALDLLTSEAVESGLLSNTEKANVIYALQNIGLRGSCRRQEAVKRILLSTRTEELTELKMLLDGTGNYHNFYKLIYSDLSVDAIRNTVLRHLGKQAKKVRQNPYWIAGIKVCSDIDDTLYSSGGRFPAGCDRQYPRGVVYPGCTTLFRVLDKTWEPNAPSSNLAFLSARPHVYKSWSEKKSYDLFWELVEHGRLHSIPTMIPGKLGLGLWALIAYPCLKTLAWKRVGEFKYQTYKKFAKLYLEYDFVFCGDDGQGDLYAGQRMTQNGRSERVLDEFLGDESGSDEPGCPSSDDSDSESSVSSSCAGSPAHPCGQPALRTCQHGDRSFCDPWQLRSKSTSFISRFERRAASSGERNAGGSYEVSNSARGAEEFLLQSPVVHTAATQVDTSRLVRFDSAATGGRIRCVLIHEVLDVSKNRPLTAEVPKSHYIGDASWREDMRARKLFFHSTYVGAAVQLHLMDRTLVSLADLQKVGNDATQEFEEARLMYPEMKASWETAERNLLFDLEQANAIFTREGLEPVRLIRSRSQVELSDDDTIIFSATASVKSSRPRPGVAVCTTRHRTMSQ